MYTCKSHRDCQVKLKCHATKDDENRDIWVVEKKGKHASELVPLDPTSKKRSTGVPDRFKDEVDGMFKAGAKPGRTNDRCIFPREIFVAS